jgi:hypothetical protein
MYSKPLPKSHDRQWLVGRCRLVAYGCARAFGPPADAMHWPQNSAKIMLKFAQLPPGSQSVRRLDLQVTLIITTKLLPIQSDLDIVSLSLTIALPKALGSASARGGQTSYTCYYY